MPRVPSEKSKVRPTCKICGNQFAGQTGLSRHKRLHDPFAIWYECPYCHKSMSQKANLNAHIEKLHSGPHKCPVSGCCMAFLQPRGLERHVRKCKGPQHLDAARPSSSALSSRHLLPAINAGMPLEGLGVFPASPQSDLDASSPKELISVSDSSPTPYEPPALPAVSQHQPDRQGTDSNAETLKEIEQWLQTYSNTSTLGLTGPLSFDSYLHGPSSSTSSDYLCLTDPVSFDSSFHGPSSSTSSDYLVSSASTAFLEDNKLSRPTLASYLPLDDSLEMHRPPTLGAADMTVPSPVDHSSISDISFNSFETTNSSFSFDFDLLLPSSSSFPAEQPLFDLNFDQSVDTAGSIPLF